MNKKISIIIWLAVVCAVLIAAYTFYSKNKPHIIQPQPQQSTVSDQLPRNSDTSDQSEQEKIMAPDFSLKDLSGNTVKLSDYNGKIVILNFWAVWCKYCKLEMPDLNELNKELEKENEAVILAIDVEEPIDTVKEYLDSNNINLNVLFDSDGSVTQAYGISGFPTTFVIDSDGSIYTYIPGATDKETLQEIIDRVKKGEPVR